MGYIYKITNLINGKKYIGQTSESVTQRWYEHIYSSSNPNCKDWDTTLHRAIRKYGKENFNIETIDENTNDQLNNLEIYWIAYYNTYHSGYNMTMGGEGSRTLNYQHIYDLWDSGYGIKKIAQEVGCSDVQAREILKGYQNYSREESWKRGADRLAKNVNQYDLEGNFIQRYRSASEAARILQISPSSILATCNGKQNTCSGYQWRFDGELPLFHISSMYKPAQQFSLDGKYIATFESISEAARSMKCNTASITNACHQKTKHAYGYLWRFVDDNGELICDDNYVLKNINVVQYDLQGNYIATFNSVADVANKFGVSCSSIYRVCNKTTKTSCGYIWRYLGDSDVQPEQEWQKIKSINQYDIYGNYIATFDSISEAAECVGVSNASITRAYQCVGHTSGGFQWRLVGDSTPLTCAINNHYKSVCQYDLNGNLINTFTTMKEAGAQTNSDPSSIRKCCIGKLKTTNGYIWKYKNDLNEVTL